MQTIIIRLTKAGFVVNINFLRQVYNTRSICENHRGQVFILDIYWSISYKGPTHLQ